MLPRRWTAILLLILSVAGCGGIRNLQFSTKYAFYASCGINLQVLTLTARSNGEFDGNYRLFTLEERGGPGELPEVAEKETLEVSGAHVGFSTFRFDRVSEWNLSEPLTATVISDRELKLNTDLGVSTTVLRAIEPPNDIGVVFQIAKVMGSAPNQC